MPQKKTLIRDGVQVVELRNDVLPLGFSVARIQFVRTCPKNRFARGDQSPIIVHLLDQFTGAGGFDVGARAAEWLAVNPLAEHPHVAKRIVERCGSVSRQRSLNLRFAPSDAVR